MVPRYSRPNMVKVWQPENKFKIWFEIEAHACDALAIDGQIPFEAAKAIWKKGNKEYTTDRISRISEIEQETKHDVIAFLTELAEKIGDESRYVHLGMTSSDILDTCLAVQIKQATNILMSDLDNLLKTLKKRAQETKLIPIMGRSHGIHAEPTTVGLKFARFYAEFFRNRNRLETARKEIATCAISGAVGTFANINPSVESYVAAKLGLDIEPISTQVIPRDRHAYFFATLAVIASSVENLATEIRHMQRTEVQEVQEYFAPNQKGSSAMPQKQNPILTENLTGLARLVRSSVIPALENVALWHERDISHSSVERMIFPDVTITLDFALARLSSVIDTLIIYPKKMRQNLDAFGGIYDAQRVLLFLVNAGLSRDAAYGIVQRNALKVWEQYKVFSEYNNQSSNNPAHVKDLENHSNLLLHFLARDKELTGKISISELESLLGEDSLAYHMKWVDTIFNRVFSE